MKLFHISTLLLASIFISSAQVNTNINLNTSYDDNLYRSPTPKTDKLTSFDISLSYSAKGSSMRFFLNPNYFTYKASSERNFMLNQIGLGNYISLDKSNSNKFYFGAQWDLRINGDLYNYYDYNQLYAYANLNFNLNYFILKGGYNYRYRSYANLPDLTNNRHYLYVQTNKSFPTRTTFILEADLGYKSFAGQDLFHTSSGGRGQGRLATGNTTITSTEIPSISQAVFLARIAQSLHTKFGIFVQYRKQISLDESTDYVNSDSYFQDEELFDDPFSYNSDAVTSRLTWMMPWKMKLQVGGGTMKKKYVSELAYESAEDSVAMGPIRSDDQTNYHINLSKSFFPRKSWLHNLKLNLNYAYMRNKSNSYWYDYKNSVYSGGLNWNF